MPEADGTTEELRHTAAVAERTKLVVLDGPREGIEIILDRPLVVGTDPACDLVLEDRAVSRRHAEFRSIAGRVRVEDLGSRNGTFVASTRVDGAEVPLGALVKLGATTLCVHPAWRVRELAPSSARRFGELYGESLGMREVFAVLERVAPSAVTVLIEGETGTGKELAARSIHGASTRMREPFVVFDCTAVPPNLAESELFGHVKGAFTGAVSELPGAFERADGGTLFLDEIGELSLELQPKLLRVLEAGCLRRVGAANETQVNVRVIAATNRDLHAEARRGRFRDDLLYRLDVVKVRLPPLRQRPEDIQGLVTHLLMGQLPAGDVVEGENLKRLTGYGWPGNVRELRNVLQRAVTLGRTTDGKPAAFSDLVVNLGPSHAEPATLGTMYPGVAAPLPFKEAKEQLLLGFERAYVDALLARHGGNLTQAAAAAQLSRKHLYELMRKTRGDS